MSVTTEIGVDVNFKDIVPVGIEHDSLSPRGLQVLYKVDYSVSMGRSRILREAGALMRRVGNIWYGDILQEVELSHDCSIVEALVKRRSGSVTTKNFGGQGWRLSWRGVLGEMDSIDDDINDMCLR